MHTHIHISGAGSIGLLFAYHLTKAGKQVTLITRNNKHKKQSINYCKDSLKDSVEVTTKTAEKVYEIDTLIVSTKVFDSKQACLDLKHAIGDFTTIILLHNGMGGHAEVIKAFPENTIYAALTTEAAKKNDIYSILHTGSGVTKIAPLLKSRFDNTLIKKLSCEINIVDSLNIQQDIWRKFAVNCCINPLSVIYNCLNGELLHNKEALSLGDSIIQECKQLAIKQAAGQYLEGIENECRRVMRMTATNSSSMREDILNKRPSEIDYLNGYIIRESHLLGLTAPINQRIYKKIRTVENIAK